MPRRQQSNVKSKHWIWTLNNPTEAELAFLRSEGASMGEVEYLIFGHERGEGGTYHLQGYATFRNRKRLTTVKSWGLTRAHLEIKRGSCKEASDYCKKDGEFEEFGALPRERGHRADLDAIQEKIKGGVSNAVIADEHFSQWVQYRKSFEAYRALQVERRAGPPQVIVLEGKTGVGKTRFATDIGLQSGGYWICNDPTLQWFDGYQGQPVAIIDDFDGRKVNYRFLLRLLDRYDLDVPIKGGYVAWVPRIIFLTTNTTIESWFPDVDVAPLRRRVRWEHIRGYLDPMTWEEYFEQIKNKLSL